MFTEAIKEYQNRSKEEQTTTKKGGWHMNKLKRSENIIIFIFIIVFVLPIALIYLLFKFLATPFDYIKYKSSRYQRDFPHKYSWLSEPHFDNAAYTAIKENNLPVEYIKWSEDYNLCGYFVYKNILLDFTEPFFFDEEGKVFLRLPDDENETEEITEDEISEDKNSDKSLTVEETKELILDGFRNSVPGRECHKIVFFYSRKDVERDYKEEGLNAMRELNDFIIYEKGELAKVIKDFIENN